MFNISKGSNIINPLNNWKVIVPASIYVFIWIVLAINPVYRPEWLMENYLVFLIWPLLILSFLKYRLSNISYLLIFIYLTFHSFGAHYGYCDVPFGFWLSKYLGLERPNAYDRLVHFLFGFLLTYPLHEFLKKFTNLSSIWLIILPSEFILSYSAFYELIEAITAWTMPDKDYNAFVGLQGDIWDGYRDMLCAFIGSLLVTFANVISIFIKKLKNK